MYGKDNIKGEGCLKELSDEFLALKAQNGDRNSFEELFLRYRDFLFAYILNVVRDYYLAEDFFQETFTRAFAKINTFNGKNFQVWLFSIARHLIIDHWKKLKVRKKHPFIVIETKELEASPDADPFKKLADIDTLHKVSKCIEKLPFKLREALIMRTIMGMDYEEISKLTGTNQKTLKVRVFRARVKLAKMLEGVIE